MNEETWLPFKSIFSNPFGFSGVDIGHLAYFYHLLNFLPLWQRLVLFAQINAQLDE